VANFRILRTRLVEQKSPRTVIGKVYREGRDWFGITILSDVAVGPFPRQIPAGEAVYDRYVKEVGAAKTPAKPAPPKKTAPPKVVPPKKVTAPKKKAPPKPPPVVAPLPPEPEPLPEPPKRAVKAKKWNAGIPATMPPAKKPLPAAKDLAALIRFLDAAFKKLPSNIDGIAFEGERREHSATSPSGTFGVDHGTFSRGRHWAAFGVSDGDVQIEYLLTGEIPTTSKSPAGARVASSLDVAQGLLPLIAVAYQRGRMSVTLPSDTLELTFEGDITGSLTGRNPGGGAWARHLASRMLGIY
jgi:hypothetical protein